MDRPVPIDNSSTSSFDTGANVDLTQQKDTATVILDSGAFPQDGADELTPKVVVHRPSFWTQQFSKFTNTVLSCATVSTLRVIAKPPTPGLPANAELLPAWYVEEFKKRTTFRTYAKQYFRDTVLLSAASYLMDGVEAGIKALRDGKQDPINKTIGGLAAGAAVGYAWFPANPAARAWLTSTGALVGYVAFAAGRTSERFLLEQQMKLEKDVLQLPDASIKKELDTDYLRELVRMKQAEMIKAQQAKMAAQQAGGLPPAPAGSLASTLAGGAPAPAAGASSSGYGLESSGPSNDSGSGATASPLYPTAGPYGSGINSAAAVAGGSSRGPYASRGIGGIVPGAPEVVRITDDGSSSSSSGGDGGVDNGRWMTIREESDDPEGMRAAATREQQTIGGDDGLQQAAKARRGWWGR